MSNHLITFLVGGTPMHLSQPTSLADAVRATNGHSDPMNPIVGAIVDGRLTDLGTEITSKPKPYVVDWVHFRDPAARDLLRHSMAHLTAQAIQRLYGQASSKKIRICQGIGPATEDGFFQEFDFAGAGLSLTERELVDVEAAMREIVAESLDIRRRVVSRDEARIIFSHDPLKHQIIDRLPDNEPISIYTQGEYQDLCRGPHVPNTNLLGAFKLLRASTGAQAGVAGTPLTRVSGTGFATTAELDAEMKRREEATKRDHRKIGPTMELFHLSEMAPGAVFFLKNGTRLRQILIEDKRRLLDKYGFEEVVTPTLFRREMWETSGHWAHYRQNMFCVRVDDEDVDYALKPMNCPGHVLLYQSRPRSYRELPIRIAEFGTVHRYERSGVLSGLHRVRSFTQDDAHLFVRPDQLRDEVMMLIKLYLEFYQPFGFEDLKLCVSTRPQEKLGSEAEWDAAEAALIGSLESLGLRFQINPRDGAFYGPKIDFHLSDCIGRMWQCGTIQVDFQLPQRFELSYVGSNGVPERPIMIHPATMGSIERFMAIIIEHFEGKFPTWLAPVQALILPVSERQANYAHEIGEQLRTAGIRFGIERADERLSKKIRDVQPQRVPYLLVVGSKEETDRTVSVRDRTGSQQNAVHIDRFVRQLRVEVAERRPQANVSIFQRVLFGDE
jgi:threonyl-tRNA synthetase